MAVWSASTALYEAHFGSQEAARALLRDAVESGLERVGWDTLRLVALAFYTEAASRLRALDAAALVHEQMAPWHDQFVWSGAPGTAMCVCGSGWRPRRCGGTTRPTSISPSRAASTTTTA